MILASSLITDLDNLWGPHTCDRDRFVCPYNTKVQCFSARFYQPGSSGVNAFSPLTGFVPRFIWGAKLPGTWSFSALRELSLFQSGSRPTFGQCFALMEFTGVTLFMTGLFYPISLIYLLHAKLKTLFWLQASIVCFSCLAYWLNRTILRQFS